MRTAIDRNRKVAHEKEIALDPQAERQADRFQLQEAEAAEFGTAETEIGQPEQRIAILVEFGREPSASADRIEEADNRDMVSIAVAAIGKKTFAQLWREEDHAALLSLPALASIGTVTSSGK
ncbi:hypothetical protein NKG60_05015 [Mesorhizobium sp. M1428]